ncbi:type VI secretion system protein TssA [Roseateles sp.]|uniref:type VI secretion system protein TssA n=1 Tax=Roseateles sp. TaxID=1971397 RepID=UPI00286BD1ED|nr:type VI secretion system protein TssA [Roseateles sp.]
MSDFEAMESKVAEWLLPLPSEASPCGPDLEYDNEFLALTQAAAGKPESQFGPAELPVWRNVVGMAEALMARTRDLRIAILWLRGCLHTQGYGAFPVGLKLLHGLISSHWTPIHPLPDPDDGDPYARVNALTLLRENEGLLGDLRAALLVEDRSIGLLSVRAVELALGLATARSDEETLGQGPVKQMLAAALAKDAGLRAQCQEAVTQVRQLTAALNEALGSEQAPDLRPLYSISNGVLSCLPADEATEATSDQAAEGANERAPGGAAAGASSKKGLSGSVNSREDAIRAIAMVCEYLERAEPANPAQLFLRRGSQLINQNFLQLMKLLAPDALSGVAGLVGVDPYSIDGPEQ